MIDDEACGDSRHKREQQSGNRNFQLVSPFAKAMYALNLYSVYEFEIMTRNKLKPQHFEHKI